MISLRQTLPLLTAATLSLSIAGISRADETFDSDGTTISYAIKGKGKPVILIHGWLASGFMNWDLPGTSNLLAKDYRVIRIDMPGHGKSEKTVDKTAYGLEMVEHVARLMDHLEIPKAHLVGYSMGGMITAKFLSTHPDRAFSGTLCGMGWLREGSPQQKSLERGGGGGKPMGICLQSLAQLALSEKQIRTIRVPTRVIIGDKDVLKKGYVDPLEPVRPDWRVVEIEGADHITCVFRPEFKDAIADWLAE